MLSNAKYNVEIKSFSSRISAKSLYMPESPIVLVIAVGNLLVQCGTKAKIDLKLDKMIVKQIFLG